MVDKSEKAKNSLGGGDVIFPQDEGQQLRQTRAVLLKEYPDAPSCVLNGEENVAKYGLGTRKWNIFRLISCLNKIKNSLGSAE